MLSLSLKKYAVIIDSDTAKLSTTEINARIGNLNFTIFHLSLKKTADCYQTAVKIKLIA